MTEENQIPSNKDKEGKEKTNQKEEIKKNSASPDLEKKVQELEAQKAEYLAGWQRARADFLNYKREEAEKLQDLLGYAREELMEEVLPILDNFDLVEKKIPGNLSEDSNIKGILQIKTQILDFLKSNGVEVIKTENQIFDPNFHEVVGMVEKEGKCSGMIIEEMQKGYMVNGRILRPAKVKVAK